MIEPSSFGQRSADICLSSAYLPRTSSPYSDVVSLAVFEHQAHMMNLLTRIGWDSRVNAQSETLRPDAVEFSSCGDTLFRMMGFGRNPASLAALFCALFASFTHTVGSGGNTTFSSTSSGTGSTTIYAWDFGDGSTGLGATTFHTYQNGGAHAVKLKVKEANCSDSIIYSVNITGITCAANSNFTVFPSGTPQYWIGTPGPPRGARE